MIATALLSRSFGRASTPKDPMTELTAIPVVAQCTLDLFTLWSPSLRARAAANRKLARMVEVAP